MPKRTRSSNSKFLDSVTPPGRPGLPVPGGEIRGPAASPEREDESEPEVPTQDPTTPSPEAAEIKAVDQHQPTAYDRPIGGILLKVPGGPCKCYATMFSRNVGGRVMGVEAPNIGVIDQVIIHAITKRWEWYGTKGFEARNWVQNPQLPNDAPRLGAWGLWRKDQRGLAGYAEGMVFILEFHRNCKFLTYCHARIHQGDHQAYEMGLQIEKSEATQNRRVPRRTTWTNDNYPDEGPLNNERYYWSGIRESQHQKFMARCDSPGRYWDEMRQGRTDIIIRGIGLVEETSEECIAKHPDKQYSMAWSTARVWSRAFRSPQTRDWEIEGGMIPYASFAVQFSHEDALGRHALWKKKDDFTGIILEWDNEKLIKFAQEKENEM